MKSPEPALYRTANKSLHHRQRRASAFDRIYHTLRRLLFFTFQNKPYKLIEWLVETKKETRKEKTNEYLIASLRAADLWAQSVYPLMTSYWIWNDWIPLWF